MQPKNEAVPPSSAPSIHSGTNALIDPRLFCVPNQAHFVETILPFTFVGELDHEWLVVYISWKHSVRPDLLNGFLLHILSLFGVTKVSGFMSPMLGTH